MISSLSFSQGLKPLIVYVDNDTLWAWNGAQARYIGKRIVQADQCEDQVDSMGAQIDDLTARVDEKSKQLDYRSKQLDNANVANDMCEEENRLKDKQLAIREDQLKRSKRIAGLAILVAIVEGVFLMIK